MPNANYSITGGNSALFTIDQRTGVISWAVDEQMLDYEDTPFYLFNIMCQDVSGSATAVVNVSVESVNEFVPVISPSVIFVIVEENAPMGTSIVSTEPGGRQQYSVIDRDDGPDGVITFSFTNVEDSLSGLFVVDPVTGNLTLSRELDVDNPPTGTDILSVRITACDTVPPRSECQNLHVSIIVQSAGDNNPMFESDQTVVMFPEDTAVGTTIASSMCSDLDVGVGSYAGIRIMSVIPPDAIDLFRLDSDDDGNGILVLVEQLDYETTHSYNLTLQCYDNQMPPSEDIARVYVLVHPINDEAPRFQNSFYSFTVNRITASGEDIGQVIATDNDEGVGREIAYSILSGDVSNFGVRPDGMVYLKDFVFASEGESFELVVMASDGKFNSTTEVIITMPGFLSIPEIVIIVVSATTFILIIVIVVVIVCVCRFCKRVPRYVIVHITIIISTPYCIPIFLSLFLPFLLPTLPPRTLSLTFALSSHAV